MRGKGGISFTALVVAGILLSSLLPSISDSAEVVESGLEGVPTESTLGHAWANYTTLQDLPQGHGTVTGTEANTHGPGVQSIQEVKYSGLGVILNAFWTSTDWVELYNDGPGEVDMSGWTYFWHDQRGYSGTYTVPSGPLYVISVQEKVVLMENAGTDTESTWYINQNVMWDSTSGGIAAEIRNPSAQGVDFFRTGIDTTVPTPPCQWFSPEIPHPVPDGGAYRDVVGLMNDVEYNSGLDWVSGGPQPPITHITYYSLEHNWQTQTIPSGADDLTLFVTGYKNTLANDDFQFSYSTNFVDWVSTGIMVSAPTPTQYSAALPPVITGYVYLRVTDTNYWDPSNQDTLFVDDIHIQYHNYTYVPVYNVDKDTYHPTIQEGVDLADPGNTLEVANGTYVEDVVVDKTLTIVGEDRNTTIVDGAGSGEVFFILADYVNISGFNIINGSTGVKVGGDNCRVFGNIVTGHSSTGIITTWNTHHNSIFDNEVFGISFYGIQLGDNFGNSHNNSVWGNTVHNTGFFGIYVLKSWSNDVYNNTAFDNGEFGIYLKLSYHTEVHHNELHSNVYGICLRYDARYNTVHNNTLYSNNKYMQLFQTAGIALEYGAHENYVRDNLILNQSHANGTGINVDWSDGNVLVDNTINVSTLGVRVNSTNSINVVDNHVSGLPDGYGIVLNNSHNGTYTGNMALLVNCGIFINASDNNTFQANDLQLNDVGMVMNSTSARNLIFGNNFIGNTKNARDLHPGFNFWNATYPTGGNYWDDYSGPDIFSGPNQTDPGSDGFGDSPYFVSSTRAPPNNDHYPLMWPSTAQDDLPPEHINHFPAIGGSTADYTPTISLHVIDPSGVNASTIRLRVNGFLVFYDLDPVPTGHNVSYTHTGGFSPGDTITCRIIAEDMVGNELDFTWNFTILDEYSIPLDLGWNLVSFPLTPSDTSIVNVLGSIDGNYDLVQHYDVWDPADPWKSFAAYKPQNLNDLHDLDNTMSFWIYINDNSTPLVVRGTFPTTTVIQLRAGWNMVGYPTMNATLTVSEAFFGTTADRVMVGNASEPYNLMEVGPGYAMMPAKGYFVHAVADTVWTVDW